VVPPAFAAIGRPLLRFNGRSRLLYEAIFFIAPLREQLALLRAGGVDFTGFARCFAPPAALCLGSPLTRLRADLSVDFDLIARIILFAYRLSSLLPVMRLMPTPPSQNPLQTGHESPHSVKWSGKTGFVGEPVPVDYIVDNVECLNPIYVV